MPSLQPRATLDTSKAVLPGAREDLTGGAPERGTRSLWYVYFLACFCVNGLWTHAPSQKDKHPPKK